MMLGTSEIDPSLELQLIEPIRVVFLGTSRAIIQHKNANSNWVRILVRTGILLGGALPSVRLCDLHVRVGHGDERVQRSCADCIVMNKASATAGPRSNALACDEGPPRPRSCTLHATRLPTAALAAARYTLAADQRRPMNDAPKR